MRGSTDTEASGDGATVIRTEGAGTSSVVETRSDTGAQDAGETEYDVIVISAGKSIELKSTVTPSDASNRKVK